MEDMEKAKRQRDLRETIAAAYRRMDEIDDEISDLQDSYNRWAEEASAAEEELKELGEDCTGVMTHADLRRMHEQEKTKYERLAGRPYTGPCQPVGIEVI